MKVYIDTDKSLCISQTLQWHREEGIIGYIGILDNVYFVKRQEKIGFVFFFYLKCVQK